MEPEDFEVESFYQKYRASDIQESEIRAMFGLAARVHYDEIFKAKELDDEGKYILEITERITMAGITLVDFIALMIYMASGVDFICRNIEKSPLEDVPEDEPQA